MVLVFQTLQVFGFIKKLMLNYSKKRDVLWPFDFDRWHKLPHNFWIVAVLYSNSSQILWPPISGDGGHDRRGLLPLRLAHDPGRDPPRHLHQGAALQRDRRGAAAGAGPLLREAHRHGAGAIRRDAQAQGGVRDEKELSDKCRWMPVPFESCGQCCQMPDWFQKALLIKIK